MLKQLQKFFWKDEAEDTKTRNDKVVKYLYRRELDITENSLHWKIKNENCPNTARGKFSKQHSVKTKNRSRELLIKKPKKEELNEAGAYFIPPKEIRRHRKYQEKSREKSTERLKESRKKHGYGIPDKNKYSEERKSRKGNDISTKFINENFEDDVQQLTKLDLFRLISIIKHVPKNAGSTTFLKKILNSNKQEPVHQSDENLEWKPHRCKEDDIDVIFMPSTSAASPRSIKHHKKENRERTVYEKELRKQDENILGLEESNWFRNKKTKHRKSSDDYISKIKTNVRHRALISKEIVKENSNQKFKNYLVHNTFSLVDIPPTYAEECKVGRDAYVVINNKYETFSNRHKTFQYKSQNSHENVSKKSFKEKGKGAIFRQKPDLAIENHVSAIGISPKISHIRTTLSGSNTKIPNVSAEDCEKKEKDASERKRDLTMESYVSVVTIKPKVSRIWNEAASQCDRNNEDNNKINKAALCKSKIPVSHNNVKAVESSSELSPISKKPQSSTLFILKPLKEKSEESVSEEKPVNKTFTSYSPRNRSLVRPKKEGRKLKTKTGSQKSSAYLGPVITPLPRVPSSTVEVETHYSTKPKIDKKGSKLPTRITLNSKQKNSETSKTSSGGTNSVGSKSSQGSERTIAKCRSDTKLQRKEKMVSQKKYKSCDRSVSNSTCSNPSQKEKSFFLTKSFKDNDKLSRLHKQKMYSDNLRKRRINKSKKTSTQIKVMTTQHQNEDQKVETIETEEVPNKAKEFYEDDLPQPCLELVDCNKFKEIFEAPVEEALNKILCENYDFMNKDFSLKIDDLDDESESGSSEENLSISSGDLLSLKEKETDTWYDFQLTDNASLGEIAWQKSNRINIRDLNLGTKDYILDSLSPPGSEESGYTSMNSRQESTSFFEQPAVKSLLDTPFETPTSSYFIEVQVEEEGSSNDALVIRPIQTKSLQASVDCSQKSIQTNLSKEDISDGNKKVEDTDGLHPQVLPTEVKNIDVDNTQLSSETACVLEEVIQKISKGSQPVSSSTRIKTKSRSIRKKFRIKFMSCISCGSFRE